MLFHVHTVCAVQTCRKMQQERLIWDIEMSKAPNCIYSHVLCQYGGEGSLKEQIRRNNISRMFQDLVSSVMNIVTNMNFKI